MTQFRPVGSYLTRFDKTPILAPPPLVAAPEEEAVGFAGFAPIESAPPPPPAPALIMPEPVDEERLREELRAEIEKSFAEKLEEEKRALVAEKKAFEEKFDADRAAWRKETGARIAEEIRGEFDKCAASLRDALAGLLKPFLSRQFLEKSLNDFVEVVTTSAADRDNPVVELEGPADLLEIVAGKLEQENIVVRVIEKDRFDVSARIDSTQIETRMEEWLRRLKSGD
jgi:citrate lyase gamma subunit